MYRQTYMVREKKKKNLSAILFSTAACQVENACLPGRLKHDNVIVFKFVLHEIKTPVKILRLNSLATAPAARSSRHKIPSHRQKTLRNANALAALMGYSNEALATMT